VEPPITPQPAWERPVQIKNILIGIGYALVAILIAVLIVIPVFWVVNLIYTRHDGLVLLLISSIVVTAALVVLLRNRRVAL
jgi:hypothetical protein